MFSHKLSITALTPIFFTALLSAQNPSGYTITTFAGNNNTGYAGDGGAANLAQIANPTGLAVDTSNNLYIADQSNHRIRKVSGGVINTIAGNGTNGFLGDGAAATAAELSNPLGVAVDSSGNYYICDYGNSKIRKVTSSGTISSIAGTDTPGFGGDGAAANLAQISAPTGITLDSSGNIYFIDFGNRRVRKITSSGTISTVAGNGQLSGTGDGGSATTASLNNPQGVAVDAAGNLYIADTGNNRIRRVDKSGVITTIAGTGSTGAAGAGDGGPATSAALSAPRSVAVDAAGNIYITEYTTARVRKIVAGGTIITIAGNKSIGYSGDGGPATSASFRFPTGLAVDSNGIVYVSDTGNNVVRALTPAAGGTPSVTANGVVSAAAFGTSSSIAPGTWIEIYGSNLAADTRSWATADFSGSVAPAALDGTTVSIGGYAAYIDYVSPSQVNVQVPSAVGTGAQDLKVTTANGASAAYSVNVNATQPGLYAPPLLKIGGNQYVGAFFNDGTWVLPPSAVSGITSKRAKPGDQITMYGIGFGAVVPDTPAGRKAPASSSLASSIQIMFDTTAAQVTYSGLAPGAVGLYQFNLVVPAIPDSDTVPVTFKLGGVAGSQILVTAVSSQ